MRLFYEEWQAIFTNRPLTMDDFALAPNSKMPQAENSPVITVLSPVGEVIVDLDLLTQHLGNFDMPGFSANCLLHGNKK